MVRPTEGESKPLPLALSMYVRLHVWIVKEMKPLNLCVHTD